MFSIDSNVVAHQRLLQNDSGLLISFIDLLSSSDISRQTALGVHVGCNQFTVPQISIHYGLLQPLSLSSDHELTAKGV